MSINPTSFYNIYIYINVLYLRFNLILLQFLSYRTIQYNEKSILEENNHLLNIFSLRLYYPLSLQIFQ